MSIKNDELDGLESLRLLREMPQAGLFSPMEGDDVWEVWLNAKQISWGKTPLEAAIKAKAAIEQEKS